MNNDFSDGYEDYFSDCDCPICRSQSDFRSQLGDEDMKSGKILSGPNDKNLAFMCEYFLEDRGFDVFLDFDYSDTFDEDHAYISLDDLTMFFASFSDKDLIAKCNPDDVRSFFYTRYEIYAEYTIISIALAKRLALECEDFETAEIFLDWLESTLIPQLRIDYSLESVREDNSFLRDEIIELARKVRDLEVSLNSVLSVVNK